MNTIFVIKRDVDCNGAALNGNNGAFWCGRNGGGWSGYGATGYETLKKAEAAMKRNAKSDWSFVRGYAYIVELDTTSADAIGAH